MKTSSFCQYFPRTSNIQVSIDAPHNLGKYLLQLVCPTFTIFYPFSPRITDRHILRCTAQFLKFSNFLRCATCLDIVTDMAEQE